MERKTKMQQLKDAIRSKDWKLALSIAKKFTVEFNKEEQKIIQIAHECKDQSSANFYKGIGVNIEENNKQAIKLLENYIIKNYK